MTSWGATIRQDGDVLAVKFTRPVQGVSMRADAARRLAAGLLVAAAALERDEDFEQGQDGSEKETESDG